MESSQYWWVQLNKSTKSKTHITSWIEERYIYSEDKALSLRSIKKLVEDEDIKLREASDYSEELFKHYNKQRPHAVYAYNKGKQLQRAFIGGRFYHISLNEPKDGDPVFTGYSIRTFKENPIKEKCFPMVYISDKTKCKKVIEELLYSK